MTDDVAARETTPMAEQVVNRPTLNLKRILGVKLQNANTLMKYGRRL